MTPQARAAAAIGCLDRVLAGEPAERVLTNWARANRYAGSGDRAAVRDIVFDGLRRRRSAAAVGGAETGRGIVLGLVRQGVMGKASSSGAHRADGEVLGSSPEDDDPEMHVARLFDGSRYGPEALGAGEGVPLEAGRAARLDVQDWCLPLIAARYGAATDAILGALRDRAPVFVRANLLKTTRNDLLRALDAEGIVATPDGLSPTALRITEGARKLVRTNAHATGLFEMQDAASQAAVDVVADVAAGADVLDYCAGGGGKALALAALGARVTAHDADVRRMADLPTRAARAGAEIAVVEHLPEDRSFDLVFVDAPCSGSGAWRRQPEAKWRLSAARLAELVTLQGTILRSAAARVRPGGTLVYATCSLFREENDAVVDAVEGDWAEDARRQFTPLDGGDGFFAARFRATSRT